MRPRIGITCALDHRSGRISTPADYARAVAAAGGLPVLLPPLPGDPAEALGAIDGLLLAGGVDVDPLEFGEEPLRRSGEIQPDRDRCELPLCRAALARGVPVLGVCRGHQVLAVAAGGTLYQDLPTQVPGCLKHSQQAPRWHPTHTVRIQPGSRLARILPLELRVNSFHHQAVRGVPPGWTAAAAAMDGVNEAIESLAHPFAIGVQWHPEAMWDRPYHHNALFQELVAAASRTSGAENRVVGRDRGCSAGGLV